MKLALPISAFVLLMACGTETGNGLVTVKTGLTADGGDDQQGTKLTLQSAQAVLRHIEFERPGGATNCDGLPASNNANIKCDGGKIRVNGDFVVDLVARTATPSLDDLDIPAGTYRRIDARFSSNPNLLDHNTLVATGEIEYPAGMNTPFDLALKFEETATFQDSDGIEVEDDAANEVLLELDVNTWFTSLPITQCLDEGELQIENGRIRIADKGQRCKDIEKTLKDVIKNSGRLRKD